MKIAALGNNQKIVDEVIACCELLFKELFNYGHKADKISIINNTLLVNLGLLKVYALQSNCAKLKKFLCSVRTKDTNHCGM